MKEVGDINAKSKYLAATTQATAAFQYGICFLLYAWSGNGVAQNSRDDLRDGENLLLFELARHKLHSYRRTVIHLRVI